MKVTEQKLWNGWTMAAHKDYRLYSNGNDYVLFDWDDDVVLGFMVHEHVVEVYKSSWHLKYSIDIRNKTITVKNEPDEE
jgi:hypothetical protein